jgi:GNAT superfamily N-acetyltransferase
MTIQIRPAVSGDIPELELLIDLSVRTLQAADYSPPQIDGALRSVFGVDSQLVSDKTYLVAECETGGRRVVAGCGGWSRRKTLFGGDRFGADQGREDILLDPLRDAAKIRAFFVHPDWARRGIGSMILEACENAAAAAGFRGFELGATLTGERLFGMRGYKAIERIEVPLANGEALPVIRMSKWL